MTKLYHFCSRVIIMAPPKDFWELQFGEDAENSLQEISPSHQSTAGLSIPQADTVATKLDLK